LKKGDKGLYEYAQSLQSKEQKDAADKADAKTVSGEIKLSMTPDLARWIGVSTTGDVSQVNSSANANSPPSTSNNGSSVPLGTGG
jgi:hypothetical protein